MIAVLFTCAGQRVDIVTAFGRAGARTIATDVNPLAPALYHAHDYELVPRVDDPEYVPALARLVREHGARLVVPLTDLDHELLASARRRLGPALVLLSSADVVRRMGDKWLAHETFLELGLDSPPTWLPEALPDELPFPVLVKARRGFGSRGIYRARDRRELEFFLEYASQPSIVQAQCSGEEFSVDVFCDFDGRCLNAIPRTMIESKGGESIKGQSLRDPELIEVGRRVAETLPIWGPANIQCFREPDGSYPVTDVNPRFGGGFPLPLTSGSSYPRLALALARGESPEPRVGDFREGITMTRFFSELCLAPGAGGVLEPVAEDLPQPVAAPPGEH